MIEAAIRAGHVDCVRAYVANGGDINASGLGPYGHAAPIYYFATYRNHDVNMLRVLIECGSRISTRCPVTGELLLDSLCCENECAEYEILEMLLSAGVDVHTVDNDGSTILRVMCERGIAWPIHRLAEAGADVDCCDEDGDTLLIMCLRSSMMEQQCLVHGITSLVYAGVNVHGALSQVYTTHPDEMNVYTRTPKWELCWSGVWQEWGAVRILENLLMRAHRVLAAYACARVLITGARAQTRAPSHARTVFSDYHIVTALVARTVLPCDAMPLDSPSLSALENVTRLAITGVAASAGDDGAWNYKVRKTLMHQGLGPMPTTLNDFLDADYGDAEICKHEEGFDCQRLYTNTEAYAAMVASTKN